MRKDGIGTDLTPNPVALLALKGGDFGDDTDRPGRESVYNHAMKQRINLHARRTAYR